MSRNKKSQYTEKENRIIYILLNSTTKEFYIGHCREDLLIDVFKHHYYGKRFHTKESVEEIKQQGLHPCLFELEKISATKTEAYNYVIVWTKIFLEAGYKNLNRGNIIEYINDLYENNLLIYNSRKNQELDKLYNCSNCKVTNYGRKQCPLFKGDSNEK